jgi:hypothetical protein
MKCCFIILFLLAVTWASSATTPSRLDSAQQPPSGQAASHTEWIARSLGEIQRIAVGKTRGDLLEVFTTEGGLFTGLSRTYVYRECPNIKVDVEFQAVGRPARNADGRVTLDESPDDIIAKISRPYLAWSIGD